MYAIIRNFNSKPELVFIIKTIMKCDKKASKRDKHISLMSILLPKVSQIVD